VEATDREKRGKARALAGGGEGTRGKERVEEEARGRWREGEGVNVEKGRWDGTRGGRSAGYPIPWHQAGYPGLVPSARLAKVGRNLLMYVAESVGRWLLYDRAGPAGRDLSIPSSPPATIAGQRSVSVTSRSRLDGFYRSHSRPRSFQRRSFDRKLIRRRRGEDRTKDARSGHASPRD